MGSRGSIRRFLPGGQLQRLWASLQRHPHHWLSHSNNFRHLGNARLNSEGVQLKSKNALLWLTRPVWTRDSCTAQDCNFRGGLGLPFLLASAAALGCSAAWSEQQGNSPSTGMPVRDSDEVEVRLQAEELTRADAGEVVSNIHTARWRVFTDTGRDLFSQGRMEEAEKYFVRALEEAKQGFGPHDPHVASSCNNLAELYRVRRDFTRAEPLYLEAVERLKASLGPQHHSVGLALHNLGGFFLLQRNFEEARRCYEDALKIKEASMGPHHPEYANTMFHLGEVMRLQGHTADAEALIRNSLKILEETGGGHSNSALRRMGRLAEMLVAGGQLEEAEQLQRKLLHTVEMMQGPEALAAAAAAESLAGTLTVRGKLEEASHLLQRSLRIRSAVLAADHQQVGSSLLKLGSVAALRAEDLLAAGKRAEAAAEYEEAAGLLRRAVRVLEHQWAKTLGTAHVAAKAAGRGAGVALTPKTSALLLQRHLALVQSLAALGQALTAQHELTTPLAEEQQEAADREAERVFRRALAVLSEAGIPEQLAKHPEAQRWHVACLQHLAGLLSRRRRDSSPAASRKMEDEVKGLLSRAAELEAALQGSSAAKEK